MTILSKLTFFLPGLIEVPNIKVCQTIIDRFEGWVCVEQVSYVSKIQTLIALDYILWTNELAAANLAGLLEHTVSSGLWVMLQTRYN